MIQWILMKLAMKLFLNKTQYWEINRALPLCVSKEIFSTKVGSIKPHFCPLCEIL